MSNLEQWIQAAAELAERYNWPEEAKVIRETKRVPVGFGREVGEAINLFMQMPPLGGLVFLPNQPGQTYQESREEDRRHGRELGKLRTLIAKINLANR